MSAGPWFLRLTWVSLPMSQNAKEHWGSVARKRTAINDEVLVLARAAKLPKGLDHVNIALVWEPTTIRTRDEDNMAPSLKAVIDGLKNYGLVEDDNSEHVHSWSMIRPVNKGLKKQRFYVYIEQVLDTVQPGS